MIDRVIIFGDTIGIPQLLRNLPVSKIVGIVASATRPNQHPYLLESANKHDIPFLVQPKHSSPDYHDFVYRVKDIQPSLIVCHSYSLLLRPDILAIPKYGAVNVHGALLPAYRGSNPIQWALINREAQVGVTMHYMSERFDEGDIIAQKVVPIHLEDTWVDIQSRMHTSADMLLTEQLPLLLRGENTRKKQDESRASYFRRRTPEDGQFSWDMPVIDIYNLIRALVRPHPGAFFFRNGVKIVLDQYMSLNEVLIFKQQELGVLLYQSEHLYLVPMALPNLSSVHSQQSGMNVDEHTVDALNLSHHSIALTVHSRETMEQKGICTLDKLNYLDKSAELALKLTSADNALVSELLECLIRFCSRELGFSRLSTLLHDDMSHLLEVYYKHGFRRIEETTASEDSITQAKTIQMELILDLQS